MASGYLKAELVAASGVNLVGETTIDGEATENSIVLVTANGLDNGLWRTSISNWTRAADMPALARASGAMIQITRGDQYVDTVWTCTSDPPGDYVGASSLSFTQVSAPTVRFWKDKAASFDAEPFTGYRMGALSAHARVTLPISPDINCLVAVCAPADLETYMVVVDGGENLIDSAAFTTYLMSANETAWFSFDGSAWRIVAGSNNWRLVREVDYGALSSQNLLTGGNGNKTIDGMTYVLANSANATSVDITNGSGMVFGASNTSVIISGGTNTSPSLKLGVTTIFPGYSIYAHQLRVSARVLLTNSIRNFEFAGFGIVDTTAPLNQRICVLKGFSTNANRIQSEAAINGVITTQQSPAGSQTDDVLGIGFGAPNAWESRQGLYASNFPVRAGKYLYSEWMQMGTPLLYKPGQPAILFYYVTANALGGTDGFAVTFTHLRVEYCERVPGFRYQ